MVQCIWASILCLSGTYSQLLDFLIFAVVIFYILTLWAFSCCDGSARRCSGRIARSAIPCCRRCIW